MSNAALPGIALLTPKPLATEATHEKAGKTATGPAFGTALNKAVEGKSAEPAAQTPKTPTTADAPPSEQAPIPADLMTGEKAPTVLDNSALPEAADLLKPSHSLDVDTEDSVSKDSATEDLSSLPTLTDLPAPQVDQVAAQPVAIDPSTIPGLTRSAENAKPFTPAENGAGSAVIEAIRLSRTMEQRGVSQVSIPVGTGKELKGLTDKAQAVETTGEATLLPAGIAPASKAETADRSAQTAAVGAATPSDRAPAPTSVPTSTTEAAAQDAKSQPAPTVDTNTFSPTPAPVLGSSNATQITPPPPTLQAPVASQEWNEGLGMQLVNMHLRGDKSVDLHLHPADLGPISINLKVTDSSQAQVQFFSHNANVRSAIEQALPQLKEVMAQQGIALGQTSVGDQRQQQSSRDDAPRAISTGELSNQLNLVEAEPVKPSKIQTGSGQISTYA